MRIKEIILSISLFIFMIVCVVSSMLEVGLLQAALMLIAIVIFTAIIIGGMYGLGPKVFWWEYFKPNAALPITWGTLHLALALAMPDVFHEIWTTHWKFLSIIEISVFILNSIVNKDTPFEKRTSRTLLTSTFVIMFIVSIVAIGFRMFAPEFMTNLNRQILYKLATSKIEYSIEGTEDRYKDIQSKDLWEELAKITKKKKLTQTDLKEMKGIKDRIQAIYVVPEDQKINWEKILEKSSIKPESQKKDVLAGIEPSSIFHLPPGEIVEKDRNDKVVHVQTGQKIRFIQLNEPEEFWVIGDRISSYSVSQRVYETGAALAPGFIELKGDEKNTGLLTVQILVF